MTRRSLLLVFFCVFLSACQPAKPPFNSVDISGAIGYGSDFRLTDHTGAARTLADYRGKVVALFFGYTHCPDVCPTTLSEMRQVMEKLGTDSNRFQVLFVTVDPKRDTQTLLSQYVPAFNPNFVGLYGDDTTTAKVARDFKIVYQIVPGTTPESYTVDHSAGTLIFDPQGRLRLFANYGIGAEKITADVKRLF